MKIFVDSGSAGQPQDPESSAFSRFESNQVNAFKRRLFFDNLKNKLDACRNSSSLPWLNSGNPFLPISIDTGMFLEGLNRLALQSVCLSNGFNGPIVVFESPKATNQTQRENLQEAYGINLKGGDVNFHQYSFTPTDDEIVSVGRPSVVQVYEALLNSVEASGISVAISDSTPTGFFPKAQAIIVGDSALLYSDDVRLHKKALSSLLLACTSAFCTPAFGTQCEEIDDCERLEKNLAYKPFSTINILRQSYLAGAFSKRYGLGIEPQLQENFSSKNLLADFISLLKDPDQFERHLSDWDSISYRAADQADPILKTLEADVLSIGQVERQRLVNSAERSRVQNKASSKSLGVFSAFGSN